MDIHYPSIMKTLFIIITIILTLLAIISVQVQAASYTQAQEYEQDAIQYYNGKNYKRAAIYYKYAANAYNQIGNPIKVIELYNLAGSSYEQQAIQSYNDKDYDIAGTYYTDAADAYKEAGNTSKADEMNIKAIAQYKNNLKESPVLSIIVTLTSYIPSICTIVEIIQSGHINPELNYFSMILSIITSWIVHQHQGYIWTIIHAIKRYSLIMCVRFLAVHMLRNNRIVGHNMPMISIEIISTILSAIYYNISGPFLNLFYVIIHIIAARILHIRPHNIFISFILGIYRIIFPLDEVFKLTFDMDQIKDNLKLYLDMFDQQFSTIILLLFEYFRGFEPKDPIFKHIHDSCYMTITIIDLSMIAYLISNHAITLFYIIFIFFGPVIVGEMGLKGFQELFPSRKTNHRIQQLVFLLGAISIHVINRLFGDLATNLLFTLIVLTSILYMKPPNWFSIMKIMITVITIYPIIMINIMNLSHKIATYYSN